MMTLCRHTNLIGCSIEFHWQTREGSWGKRMMTKCFYVTFSKRTLLLVLYFWHKKRACYVWKSIDVVVRHDAVSGYWELGINFWKAHFSDWKWSWPSSPVLPVKHRSSRCSGCVTFSHSLTRCWDCPRATLLDHFPLRISAFESSGEFLHVQIVLVHFDFVVLITWLVPFLDRCPSSQLSGNRRDFWGLLECSRRQSWSKCFRWFSKCCLTWLMF